MTKTPKRGRGRPRKQPAPEGASLREAAAHFGVTRAKLLRYIDEGMPSTLTNERRFVDIATAQAWMDERDFEGTESTLPAAKVLHPDDARYALMVATGAIRRIDYEVECGQRVTAQAIEQRIAADLGEMGSRIKGFPAVFPVDDAEPWTRERVAAALVPIVEDALADFHFDDAGTWPQPDSLLPDEVPDDDDAEESGRVEYVPLLGHEDPRGRDAAVKAMKAEAKLAMLRDLTMDIRDWNQIASSFAQGVRWAVRLLPHMVANSIKDGAPMQEIVDAIRDKGQLILILIRGPAEADGVANVCGGKEFPSVIRMVFNLIESDDGTEFDRPEVASVDTVLAALATYPKMDAGAEFG